MEVKMVESSNISRHIILSDICIKSNREIQYSKVDDELLPVHTSQISLEPWSFTHYFQSLLKDIFLPKGYPESVSKDYLEYQIWDTCQAFCSSICGIFSMQAIMQGIGVGSETAKPVSAAITWIVKDGTGMLGSILFAWLKGSKLDSDCKKWRLFADILNDIAMFIELYIPYVINYSLHMLCIATALKALVGTAGGSTRAALITHQAIKGNIADVSAKDSSQEIFINLSAYIFGIFLLKNVTDTDRIWTLMIVAAFFHLVFNYKAVRCLRINMFNGERFRLCCRTYLPTSCVPTIEQVNRKESVFLGIGISDVHLCGFSVLFGVSLKKAIKSQNITSQELLSLVNIFQDKQYFILSDIKKKKMYVIFRSSFHEKDVLQAYFHAILLGVALSVLLLKTELCILKRSRKNSPIFRLRTLLLEFVALKSADIGRSENYLIKAYLCCEDYIDKEFNEFSRLCEEEGWNLNQHLINVDEWRADWKYDPVKTDISPLKTIKNMKLLNIKKA